MIALKTALVGAAITIAGVGLASTANADIYSGYDPDEASYLETPHSVTPLRQPGSRRVVSDGPVDR